MYWPRFRLTPQEAQYSSIYEAPNITQKHVLRRIYAGEVALSAVVREDIETFQISRRARVFGITGSGDLNQMEVKIADITGEQYTTDFVPWSLLLGGSVYDPRGAAAFNPNFNAAPNGQSTGFVFTGYETYIPYIFEPNVVIAPNQTMTFTVRPANPDRAETLHVSFCIHVWEFPGMPGSPL